MKKSIFLFSFLLSALLTVTIFAQNQNDPNLKKANDAFSKQDYAAATKAYEIYLKDNPSDNTAWYHLAYSYHLTKKYDQAIKAYEHIAGNNNPAVLYNLACACSMAGQKDAALDWLQKAVQNGFNQTATLKSDTDLNNIRQDKRFDKIVSMIKNCENTAEFHQFDFWVGEWDVYNPKGVKVGNSKIEKILKSCVILENWQSLSGQAGKSFNHYDAAKQKWCQYWISDKSTTIYFEGVYQDSSIIYYSYDHAKDSKPYIERLTFFNLGPNTVRQFDERSIDDGKTWTTGYDLTYKRKKNQS